MISNQILFREHQKRSTQIKKHLLPIFQTQVKHFDEEIVEELIITLIRDNKQAHYYAT